MVESAVVTTDVTTVKMTSDSGIVVAVVVVVVALTAVGVQGI